MYGDEAFTAFMTDAEPRLRGALVARYGMQLGREATLDAFVYGWKNWDRVSSMDNPVGYLYRVGTSHARPPKAIPSVPIERGHREPWIEPALGASPRRIVRTHSWPLRIVNTTRSTVTANGGKSISSRIDGSRQRDD